MPNLPQTQLVISVKTLFVITLFVLGIYLTYLLKDVIFALFISVLIATAINPFVTVLEKKAYPGLWRLPWFIASLS